MSTTYTVTDTPRQIISAPPSRDVSLLNLGPSTITLEDNASVSPLNGMTLPPMGQITWQRHSALWAVCASGLSAQLVVNDTAGPLDANRSHFWSLLYSTPNFPFQPAPVECGHCGTILLRLTYTNLAAISFGIIAISWQDSLGNVVNYDNVGYTNLNPPPGVTDIVIQLPVKGSSFQIVSGLNAGTKLQIFGTDRELPYRQYSCISGIGAPIPVYNDQPVGPGNLLPIGSDGAAVSGWTDYTSKTYLACLGNRLSLNVFSTGITAAGTLVIESIWNLPTVHFNTIPIATGQHDVYVEMNVPYTIPMQIRPTAALAGGSLSLGISWKDE